MEMRKWFAVVFATLCIGPAPAVAASYGEQGGPFAGDFVGHGALSGLETYGRLVCDAPAEDGSRACSLILQRYRSLSLEMAGLDTDEIVGDMLDRAAAAAAYCERKDQATLDAALEAGIAYLDGACIAIRELKREFVLQPVSGGNLVWEGEPGANACAHQELIVVLISPEGNFHGLGVGIRATKDAEIRPGWRCAPYQFRELLNRFDAWTMPCRWAVPPLPKPGLLGAP